MDGSIPIDSLRSLQVLRSLFGEQKQDSTAPAINKNKPLDETVQPKKFSFTPDEITQLEKLVSRQRRLEFKQPVRVGLKDKKELERKIMADYEKETVKKEMPKIKKALVKFGLIPPELDINKFIVALLTEQIAGFYDPETKELYLIKNQEATENVQLLDFFDEQADISWTQLAAIHELTHALQDQNFNLLTLPIDNAENDDLALATRAVVEGEANFIMFDYLFKKLGQDINLWADISMITQSNPIDKTTLMNEAPLYIREGLLFPYLQGLVFIHKIKAAEGWEKVNNLYTDLPASTEQVLHPEKYLPGKRDNPTKITLPDFSSTLADRWEFVLKNVMGELNTGILFRQFLPQLQTNRLAEGWDGDQFMVWEHQTDKTTLLLWFTTWDSLKDAQEFASGYTKIIKKKYPESVELENSEWLNIKEPASVRVWATQNNFIFIEKKDADVLIIESVPADLLANLREKTWADIKKEEMKNPSPRKSLEGSQADESNR